MNFKKEVWLGTAPFCNAKETDCDEMPGFKFQEKHKSGDGKRCLTGNKVKCVYDENLFNQSDVFNKLKADSQEEIPEDYQPEMKWYGRAPVCGAWECDAYEEDKIPVKRSKFGEGSNCMTGFKVLGVNPLTAAQKSAVQRAKEKCKLIKEKKKSKRWKVLADLAANIFATFSGNTPPDKKLTKDVSEEIHNLMKEIIILSRPYMTDNTAA